MRSAGSVARQVWLLFGTSVARVELVEGKPDGAWGYDGHAMLWLDNGLGVSLRDIYSGDEFPEMYATRRDRNEGIHVQCATSRDTDPCGVLRNATVQEVINVLNVLKDR